MTRKLCSSLVLIVGILAAAATTASGAITIGAAQTGTPILKPQNCSVVSNNVPVSCTVFISTIEDPAEAAPGGNLSPTSGVITRWHVSVGAGTTTSLTLTPRVVGFTTFFTALRSGNPHSIPAGGGVFTFEEHLPIAKNDLFAMDSTANGPLGAGPVVVANIATNASFVTRSPAVPDGGTFSVGLVIGPLPETKLMISADIEPDADGDRFGDETQDLCISRADVQAVCPPPVVTKPKLAKGAFSFTSDIPGEATTTLLKVTNGRKVGKKCKTKAKRGKKCKIYTKFAQWNEDVVAGANKIDCAYKVGGKSLKPGRYSATIVITSAQNTVTTKTLDFTIKKPKKSKKG